MFLHSIYLNMYHIISFHMIYVYVYCEINLSWMHPICFCYIRLSLHSFEVRRGAMPIKACLGSVSGRKRWTQRVSGLEGWKIRFVRFSSGTSSKSWRKRSSCHLIRTDEKPVDDKEHRRRNWDPRKIDEGMKLLMIRELNGTKLASCAMKLRRKKPWVKLNCRKRKI